GDCCAADGTGAPFAPSSLMKEPPSPAVGRGAQAGTQPGGEGRGAAAGAPPPANAGRGAGGTTEAGGGAAVGLTVQGLPIYKPPYGTLSAINLDRGEIVWQVPAGDTPDNVRNHPALKGLTIPKTGQPGVAGVGLIVTK